MNVGRTVLFKVFTVVALVASAQFLIAETSSEASRLISEKQFEEALAVLEPLVDAQPEDAFLLRLQGYALYQIGQHDDSIEVLEKAVQLAPDDPAGHFFLGNSLAATRRLDEAKTAFERTVEIDPESGYAKVVVQLLARITALEEAERLRVEAAATIPETIEVQVEVPVEPTAEELLLAQVLAYVDAGDFQSALPGIDQLLRVFPNHFELVKLKGLALLETGEIESAIAHFENLSDRFPDDRGLRLLLAQSLVRDGQLKLAASELSDLLESGDLAIVGVSEDLLAQVIAELAYIKRDTWTVVSTVGTRYDTNPAAVPVIGGGPETPSWVSTTSLLVGYELLDQVRDDFPFSVQILGVGYEQFHHDRSLRRLDVSYGSLGLHFQHDRTFLDRPLTIRAASDWAAMDRDGNDFYQSNEATAGSDWRLFDNAGVTLGYRFAQHNFANDTSAPGFFSLDGDTHTGAIGGYAFLFQERVLVTLDFIYSDANLDGTQFASNTHSGSASIRWFLPEDFEFVSQVSFSNGDYSAFIPSPTRLDRIWSYAFSLEKRLWESEWTAIVSYSKIDADSNQTFFDFEREMFGLSLRYAF